jgi:hypothetical protein
MLRGDGLGRAADRINTIARGTKQMIAARYDAGVDIRSLLFRWPVSRGRRQLFDNDPASRIVFDLCLRNPDEQ